MYVWLVGVVGVALLGAGIWGFSTQVVGMHVTECGFDSKGAYAKVRVNNLLGGADDEHVYVDFSLKGEPAFESYEVGLAVVHKPAHGSVTAVIRERYPPPRIPTGEGPDFIVQGRTVYVLGRGHEQPRFVTKKVALEHRGVSIEKVPDDPSVLRCTVTTED
jgi:hypothetical protein